MVDLAGKAVIVTGAASGIGRATAMLLAERGARVALADVNPDVDGAADEIRGRGGEAIAMTVDVTEEAQVEHLIATTAEAFSRVDGLHNNAAILGHSGDTTVGELDAGVFRTILDVNVVGYALCAKHVIPHLVRNGGGVIVNTASLAGVLASFHRPMYGASKSAVIGLTRSIATQYGKQRIRCVSISPGPILTPGMRATMSAESIARAARHVLLPEIGDPDDVAHAVAWLMSDDSRYVTGININIDGGMAAHLPNFADEMEAHADG